MQPEPRRTELVGSLKILMCTPVLPLVCAVEPLGSLRLSSQLNGDPAHSGEVLMQIKGAARVS